MRKVIALNVVVMLTMLCSSSQANITYSFKHIVEEGETGVNVNGAIPMGSLVKHSSSSM